MPRSQIILIENILYAAVWFQGFQDNWLIYNIALRLSYQFASYYECTESIKLFRNTLMQRKKISIFYNFSTLQILLACTQRNASEPNIWLFLGSRVMVPFNKLTAINTIKMRMLYTLILSLPNLFFFFVYEYLIPENTHSICLKFLNE